jgi:FkbM family methyltransferase
MNFQYLGRRFKREWAKALSECGLKSTSIYQHGRRVQIPLLHSVGASNHMILDERMAMFARICADRRPGLALDVGANVGAFFIQLQSVEWFEKDGSYIGFEPNPLCTYYVQELARINRVTDADCLCAALTTKAGLPVLYGHKLADKMASLTADFAHRAHRAPVFSTRVIAESGDAMVERMGSPAVSIVKIDVEGHESAVISGLSETLTASKPWLFCEMWTADSPAVSGDKAILESRKAMLELLSHIGYLAYDSEMNQHCLAKLNIDEFNSLGGTDVIFIPEGDVASFEVGLPKTLL